MGIQELAADNSIITLPGQLGYRRTADSLWVTEALGKAGVTEVLLGSDGATAAEIPTLRQPRGWSFDGGDQINCGDDDDFSFTTGAADEAFSLAARVRLADMSNNYAIIAKASALSAGEYYMYAANNGEVIARVVDNTAAARRGRRTTSQVLWPGIDQTVIFTCDGGNPPTLGIWVTPPGGGAPVQVDNANSNSGAYVRMYNTGDDLKIGSGAGLNDFSGDIIVPMVFDWELSPTEIEALAEIMRRTAGIP